jgi:hypothetical protein
MTATRIPISFSKFSRVVFRIVFMSPKKCYIDIDDDTVDVHLSWGYHASIPRASIKNPRVEKDLILTAGAHGWRGRWVINGNPKGLVGFDVEPMGRGHCLGWPTKLRTMIVSVDDQPALISVLSVVRAP